MRAFVTVVERKGCHDDETEMMPRQHSEDPVAHGDTGAKGSGCVMQEDGVLPDTGFPHVDGKATRNSQGTTRTRCNHEHLIHHTTFIHGRRLGGYTFQGSILERFEFVEEVVVLVTVLEVGVHVRFRRGTRRVRIPSGLSWYLRSWRW